MSKHWFVTGPEAKAMRAVYEAEGLAAVVRKFSRNPRTAARHCGHDPAQRARRTEADDRRLVAEYDAADPGTLHELAARWGYVSARSLTTCICRLRKSLGLPIKVTKRIRGPIDRPEPAWWARARYLRDEEGLYYREIATTLGKSTKAVRMALNPGARDRNNARKRVS